MSQKRKQISLEDKYFAILASENREKTNVQIALELGCVKSAVSNWLRDKKAIKEAYEKSLANESRKRLRATKYGQIEEAVYEWYQEAKLLSIPLCVEVIISKAHEFATLFNEPEFIANKKWFDRFKKEET